MLRYRVLLTVLILLLALSGIASASDVSNINVEKTIYGTYQVTWDGPSKALVELKENGTTKYSKNGRFNRTTFLVAFNNNTYQVFIDGTLGGTVSFGNEFAFEPYQPPPVVPTPPLSTIEGEDSSTPPPLTPGTQPSQTSPYHGVEVGNTPIIGTNNESLLNNSKSREFYEQNKPSYGERFTAGIIISMVRWIMNLFYMSDPVLLVFGKDPRLDDTDDFLAGGLYGSDPRDSLILGTFHEGFFAAMSILYTAFERLLPIPLAIAIVIVAIILMINSGTAEGRSKQKDYLRAFLVAFITLRFGYYFWVWVFAINNFLVDLIWAYMMDNGVVGGFFMEMIWGTGRGGLDETAKMGSLPLAILLFMATMMVVTLNYQYTMRMIILGILIALFPIVNFLSVFPAFRHSLTTWNQEFVANISMNLAHALALGGFFITLAMPGIGEGAGFWMMIAYFAGLPTVVNVVRQLIGLQGISGGVMGGVGAMMGLMAIANMARMLRPSSPGGGMMSGGGDIGNAVGGATSAVTGNGFSALKGATTLGGKVAQGAYNIAGRIASNPIVQKVAKFGVGATAAVAGGALSGMATGNPMAGLALGTGAGIAAGKAGGWALGNAGSVINTATEALSSGKGVGSSIMSDSMAKGGIIANAGWGLQKAMNTMHAAMPLGRGDVFSAPKFIDENKAMLNTSTKGMAELQPKMDVATARYEQVKAQYGKGSRWHEFNANPKTGKVVMPEEYKKAEQEYHQIKSQYDNHRANAMQANANLRSYDELKKYTENMRKDDATFSPRRGTL